MDGLNWIGLERIPPLPGGVLRRNEGQIPANLMVLPSPEDGGMPRSHLKDGVSHPQERAQRGRSSWMSKAIWVTVIPDVGRPIFFNGLSIGIAIAVVLNDVRTGGICREVACACEGLFDVSRSGVPRPASLPLSEVMAPKAMPIAVCQLTGCCERGCGDLNQR